MAAPQSSSTPLGATAFLEILNKNGRRYIDDLASSDHGGGLLQGRLNDLDIFALFGQTASLRDFIRGAKGDGKETDLFLHLLHDSFLGLLAVELAGTGLD